MSFFKRIVIRFIHTRFARKLWHLFVSITNSYYIKRLLIRSLSLEPKPLADCTVFPKIHKSNTKKNALVVMPFYGADAVGKNIDTKVQTLRNMGYTIHAVVFNDSPWDSHNERWDFTYNIKTTNANFGKLRKDVNQQIIPDGNKVDDWIDDEVLQFIAALSAINKFDIALINYVFLSKLCLALNEEATTIIDTHDVFAKRNTRMSKIGVSKDKYYFSTSEVEESRGLSRADYIFAIQEAEGQYFRSTVDSNVIVQPPILEASFVDYKTQKDNKVVVGFMASGHYPNVVAIKKFIECLKNTDHNVRLDIAGTICGALGDIELPNFVRVLGFCESLKAFYESCDVIVNPDELLSGMKVKCLEAVSFGVPLVATKASMEGILSSEHYHQLESAEECAKFIAEIEKEDFSQMTLASRAVFKDFNSRYNLESTLTQVIKENE